MARTYFFRVSIPGYFIASVFWAFMSLSSLTFATTPRPTMTGLLLGCLGFVAFGYMAIGSFINGCRLLVAWFRTNFGWRA